MFRPFNVQAPADDSTGGGAAAPAAPAAPVVPPAAAPAAPAAAPGAAPASPGNLIGEAKLGEPGAPAAPAAPTKDEQLAYLTTKGLKPEDLGKLDDAGLKAKHDELKAADGKAEAIAKVEIKVPEGAVIDEKSMGALKEILAEAKIPNDVGQKLFDMHAAAVKDLVEGPVKLWMDTQAKWQATVKADPEMGGTNFSNVTETIAKAIDSIGGKEAAAMREAFVFTGAGNHPEIVRLMYRMSKAFVEGKHVSGAAPGTAKTSDFASAAQALYPSAADASTPGGVNIRIP